MNDQPITDTVEWMERTVGLFTSKEELETKSADADLPPEAREAIADLPAGEMRRDDAIGLIKDRMMTRLGAASSAMRGFGGSS